MSRFLKSFNDALGGLKTVWLEERNFRAEIVIAIAVVFFIFYFNFSYIEAVFGILSIVLVLAAEIVNTVVEDLCDKIDPNYNKTIGKIKDVMASFVFVNVLGAAVIGAIVFINHFVYSG